MGTRSGRRLEVVDRLDTIQLSAQAIEPRAKRSHWLPVFSLVPVQLSQDLPAALYDGVVFSAPRFVEECGDLVVGHRLDTIDSQESRLASERLDLLHEPLKELCRVWGLRQDPAGAAQTDGTHSLKFSPDSHAMTRGLGWQAHQQRQPSHGVTL